MLCILLCFSACSLFDECKKHDKHFKKMLADNNTSFDRAVLRDCQNVLKQCPDLVSAHELLGMMLLDAGRYVEAIGSFEAASSRAPDNAVLREKTALACKGAAEAAATQKAFNVALEYYAQAQSLGMEEKEVTARIAATYARWGSTLIEAKKYKEAIDHYIKAYELYPESSEFRENIIDINAYSIFTLKRWLYPKSYGMVVQQPFDFSKATLLDYSKLDRAVRLILCKALLEKAAKNLEEKQIKISTPEELEKHLSKRAQIVPFSPFRKMMAEYVRRMARGEL